MLRFFFVHYDCTYWRLRNLSSLCFFNFEECYKALKACNLDIAEATNWLVDEGEREREKKELTKKKTLLLCESEVVNIPLCVTI